MQAMNEVNGKQNRSTISCPVARSITNLRYEQKTDCNALLTDRHTNMQTGKQTDRQTDIQTDQPTELKLTFEPVCAATLDKLSRPTK